MQSQEQIITQNIESKILAIRNQYVMLDRDLAELYGVPTKRLNEQVKRNSERFPVSFMFQLSEQEFENWRSQFATSSADKIGLRRPPYAFTEQGVAMLSAVLHSDTAIQMSIRIMNAFVTMRHFLQSSARVFAEIDSINRHLIA
ncbi:ORF6N domain-containing protein, partial [bacterium]|nr:ORF6N domain-containing protein [bacterium]